jgi:hypothetical protein
MVYPAKSGIDTDDYTGPRIAPIIARPTALADASQTRGELAHIGCPCRAVIADSIGLDLCRRRSVLGLACARGASDIGLCPVLLVHGALEESLQDIGAQRSDLGRGLVMFDH